jgi:hypothetical protein
MPSKKMKLIGQLITDDKPVVLAISANADEIIQTAKEYEEVFPDIFLHCEWGYFQTPVSAEKKRALSNLFGVLNAPLQNVFQSLTSKS